MLNRIQFSTGAAVGADANATATGYSPHLSGRVIAAHIAYSDGLPETANFILSDENDPAAEKIVDLTGNTDDKLYPRRPLEDKLGESLRYTDDYQPICESYVVHGRLKATIAQVNAGDSCMVTAWIQ